MRLATELERVSSAAEHEALPPPPASLTQALSNGDGYEAIAGHPTVSGTQTQGNLVYLASLNSWHGNSGNKDGGLHILYNTLLGTHDCTQTVLGQQVQGECGPNFLLRLFVTALITGLVTVAWSFAAAGLYKGALAVVDGKQFSAGQMFEGWDKGQVAIAAILIGIATAIGSFLCYVPGLIVGFLMMFTLLFIVDQQMQAIDAIKASIKLVTDNLGQTIVWALLAIVVYIVGLVVCCVGLLVAIPIILIGLAYTYRRLQGEPVAA